MSDPAASAGGVRPHEPDPVRILALVRERVWTLTVWAAMLAWTTALGVVVRDRYADFRFARFDLGNMVQAVWSTAEWRPLEMTHPTTGEQVVRLAFHVDPILVLLAPLWIVAPTPLTLVIAQVVVVALGALPVFWLARRHSGSDRVGALLALTYLMYPWTAWAGVDAFHPVSLAIPLLLFCIWFLDSDRLVPFAVCATLVAATGELMGLIIGVLGIWYALARGRREAGLTIATIGAAWTFVALFVVVPKFSGGASVFYGAFDHVGGSPWGIVTTTVTDPAAVLSAVTQGRDLVYLFLLAVPLGGAFLLAPGLAAVGLPQLALNLLADNPGPTDPHAHYVAGILPFAFGALAIGVARLAPAARVRGAVLVLVLSVAATVAVGPWPGTLLGASSWGPLPATKEHVRALERAVAIVPDDASVSATNRIGSHLSARRVVYSVPVLGEAEWVVVESEDDWMPEAWGGGSDPEALRRFQRRIERSQEWRKVFEQDGVLVFRKARA